MTTDTTAALRAAEIDADIILMAKHGVDGIYTSDPNINHDAAKIEKITHFQAMERRLNVMDSTALSMCMENKLPIIVFDMFKKGNIRKIIEGEQLGSIVSNG
jgi:uridylate kinase